MLKNNYFVQAGDTVTGCTNNNYLTQHQDISGKENTSNKVTSWNTTVTDTSYPSEKLVKDALDNKAPLSHTHGNINNNGTVTATKTTSVQNPADYGSDYFLIRDVDDSNSTKSANVIDVLNKIVEDLIDEGES